MVPQALSALAKSVALGVGAWGFPALAGAGARAAVPERHDAAYRGYSSGSDGAMSPGYPGTSGSGAGHPSGEGSGAGRSAFAGRARELLAEEQGRGLSSAAGASSSSSDSSDSESDDDEAPAPPPDEWMMAGEGLSVGEVLEKLKARLARAAAEKPRHDADLVSGPAGAKDLAAFGIDGPAGVAAFLERSAAAGAPVGPWVEHVVAAETTLPPSYEVGLRISAFDRQTAEQAVALAQRICQLCDVPVRGAGTPKPRRELISVPTGPFKHKKASMSQYWWGYHERTLAFPVRTERRLRMLLHCLRQARFPMAEVKVTLKYRTPVYAAGQAGPFAEGEAKKEAAA